MEVKLATTCLHWYHSSSYQTLASTISSRFPRRRSHGASGSLLFRSALFGTSSTKLHKSLYYDYQKPSIRTIKRACSASLESFSDEEFPDKIRELALKFQLSTEDYSDDEISNSNGSESETVSDYKEESSQINFVKPPFLIIHREPPDFLVRDEIIPASIERKANSVDLPVSLRIIKKKIQWQEAIKETRDSTYCSVKKAFSSMVFMIRELHSYTLQLREILFYEDLQGILTRVQQEMQASFVWLFQQVFSHTPTLMVYVMILLANFTVYSMGHNTAIASSSPPGSYTSITETVSVVPQSIQKNQKFDSSAIKTFSVSSSGGRSTSIGGNNGGGPVRPLASGTDGDGRYDRSDQYRTVVPDEASRLSSFREGTREGESVAGEVKREEELSLWNSIVEEASRMEGELRDESIDSDVMQRFISPVTAKIEPDNYEEYLGTEIFYQTGLSQEPNNPLLLANYAQFLYLVAHDYDRAEEYFKRAVGVEPPDAEAYNKYATFLWRVKEDLWAAEETFLEAISADPTNSYYAANYANFLWNTGGDDTCFPINSSDNNTIQEA